MAMSTTNHVQVAVGFPGFWPVASFDAFDAVVAESHNQQAIFVGQNLLQLPAQLFPFPAG
jgi:hypothetical protein